MYFWNVNRLADAFKNGAVTERQQLWYLLWFIGFTYLISDTYLMSLLRVSAVNEIDALLCVVLLVIGLMGTVACFRVSQRKLESHGFLARYICLAFPVFVRVAVFVIALLFAMFAINDLLIPLPGVSAYLEANETTVFDAIGISITEIAYFAYLRKAIQRSYA